MSRLPFHLSLLVAVAQLCWPVSSAYAADISYSVTNLGTLGGANGKALALNERGQVAGTLRKEVRGLPAEVTRAFAWATNRFIELGGLAGPEQTSRASAINDRGDVVGWITTEFRNRNAENRATLWTRGETKDLPSLGGTNSSAYAVNLAGVIAGSAQLTNGQMRAVIWRDGKPVNLGALGGGFSHAYGLNNNGTVVGVAGDTSWNRRAFLHSDGKMRDLGTLGGNFAQANAVNDHEDVCGVSMTTNGQLHAFLVPEGKEKMKDLGTFGGEFSFAYALNSYDIVGTAETKTRERHAFLYRDGKLKDLNSLIPPKSGWTLIEATAISEGGKILCMARKSDGLIYAVLLTQQGAAGPKAPSR